MIATASSHPTETHVSTKTPSPRRSPAEPGTFRAHLEETLPDVDWVLAYARIRYWGWLISSYLFVGLLYLTLIRHGLVELFDPFALRLYKLPGLSFLGWWDMTYRLDLAFVTAIVVFVAVTYSWDRALRIGALGDYSAISIGADRLRTRRAFLSYALAGSLIIVDLALMYLGVTHASWGNSGFSGVSLVVCLLYGALIVFTTLRSLELESAVTELKKS